MTRLHALAASTLVALSGLAAPSAHAEDAADAGTRLGRSLLRQLEAHPPRVPVSALTVAPARETKVPGLGDLVSALTSALAAQPGLAVRDWAALDRTLADKLRQGALRGDLDLPPLPGVKAVVILDASPTSDGKARVQVRLVAVPSGAALAADTATIGDAAVATPTDAPLPVKSGAIEITMRRMADGLAAGYYKLPGSARYRRLAVLDFTSIGPEARKRELGRVVSAELAVNLRRDHELFLVERSRLGAVLAELKLREMTAADSARVPDVARLADAQALVLGSVSDAGDHFLVEARIVSADSGEALAAASEAIPAASLVALSSDAVVLRSRKDAVYRSLLAPGWGQLYNREPKKALAFVSAETLLLGGALVFHLQGKSAEDGYHRKASGPADAVVSLRHRAERAYRTRDALLWTGLGVWAVNVADAWYSGVDGESILSARPIPGGAAVFASASF